MQSKKKLLVLLIILLILCLICIILLCLVFNRKNKNNAGDFSDATQKPYATETATAETEGTLLPYETPSEIPSETPGETFVPVISATPKSTTIPVASKMPTPSSTVKPTAKPVTTIVNYDNTDKAVDFWFDSIYGDDEMLCADGKAGQYLKSVGYDVVATNFRYDVIKLVGWVGFTEEISSFGYVIDGNAPVFGNFSIPTEQEVMSNENGGKYASRFKIAVPVADLALGGHSIYAVVKLSSGLIVRLNAASDPIRFNYILKEGPSVGLDITNKTDVVGICYTIWFNQIFGTNDTKPIRNVLNIEEMMSKYGFNSKVGFGTNNNNINAFHFWGEPAQGYYYSTDKNAAKNNLRMIANAGVDYIIVDMTYASQSGGWAYPETRFTNHIYKPSITLLDSILELRAAGEKAPYLVFWVNNDSMFSGIKSQLLNVAKYKDCFVYWNGNPFILVWNYNGTTKYSGLTVKGMSGLSQTTAEYQWSYLEPDNLKSRSKTHMPVCVATQTSYMSYTGAYGRNGGRFWYTQWKNAFEYHPKILTVTWWNEWAAQLLSTNVGYQFTDAFTMEYSRDIEPMKGGHGDKYYKWLCSYVAAYKAHQPCPRNYD